MQPAFIAGMVLASLFAAVCLGMFLRRLLPEHHLGTDTRDVVKLAVGMVATMSALLLGLPPDQIPGNAPVPYLLMSSKLLINNDVTV